MNLQHKKVRLPIAALGVTALICGVGAIASPAYAAPAPLTLNSGGTTPVVANLGYATDSDANATYALKLTGNDPGANVSLQLASAPTNGVLAYEQVANNGPATALGFQTTAGSLDADVSEQQTITEAVGVTSYTLTYAGQTTGSILAAAPAADVQAALVALNNLGPSDVTVTGPNSGPYNVTFGGTLANTNVQQMTANGTGGVVTVATLVQGSGSTPRSLGTPAASDYIYVTGNVPGTYTFRMFQDTNTNGQLDADDERSTALVTMIVHDAGGPGTTTTTTSDDVAPVISAPSPVTLGQEVTAAFTYSKPLSLADARGSGVTNGLAANLARHTFVDVNGEDAAAPVDDITGVNDGLDYVADYSPTTGLITRSIGTPTEAGTIALRADLKRALAPAPAAADNASFGTRNIVVDDNDVTDLTLAATEVEGSVKQTGPLVAVKSGTSSVTYTATAIDENDPGAGDDVPVPGAVVTFTLSGDNVADLTTNGTAVPGFPNRRTATTNAQGVASITVTSSATAATDSYTIAADSNNSGDGPLTVTYSNATASEVEVTSTPAELTPQVSDGSVLVEGKVTDQFGASFQPSSSDSQQVLVTGDATGAAVITDGKFSYRFTPAVPPTAGSTNTLTFSYAGATSDTVTIRWASSTPASSIVLTAPAEGSTGLDLQDSSSPVNSGVAVVGRVFGENNSTLPYKTLTLTGSEGVYFAADNDGTDMVKTFQAVTDNSGAIVDAFVFFTKSGTVTITATSGSVSDSLTATTDPSVDSYKVTVNDVSGDPGSTLIISGSIRDAFDNPVIGRQVDLSIGTSTLGAFGNSQPTTNSAGLYSTTFVTGTNQSGTADLTATLLGFGGFPLTENPTVSEDWEEIAGLTIPHGEYMDQATITIGAPSSADLTLEVPAKLTSGASGGNAKLSGTAMPDSTVEIWGKASGAVSYSLIKSVTTDGNSNWATTVLIKKSTYFLARSEGQSTLSKQTQLYAKVIVKAKALGGGKVSLYANGDPNAKAPLVFFRSISGVDPKLKGVISGQYGSATVTVSLPKGVRYVYATYQAPGSGKGISPRVKITVK